MKVTRNAVLFSSVIMLLGVSLATAGQIDVLQPSGIDRQSAYDTLTWRTLTEPTVNFGAEGYSPGDSVAVWFRPLAPCSLIALRFYSHNIEATTLIDVWDGSHYNGHIVTTDSADGNGWIGGFEGRQWVPGSVLGHSPIGWDPQDGDRHFWGPFPYTITAMHTGRWLEIPTDYGLQGEVDLSNHSFLISIVFYPTTSGGMAGENEGTKPYHTFKYYSDGTGPDGQHAGWFLHSTSVWIEAVVKYYEPLPGMHLELVEYTIDDDMQGRSFGNGNGLIDPGETIEFPIKLANVGTILATDVSAFLITKDAYIPTEDNFENYGGIAPGETIESVDHFVYTVSSDVPAEYTFRLSLVILGEPEYVKTESIQLKVSTLFDDVTSVAGVGDERSGRGIAWGDYDGDGFLDMYIAINGPNVLYRNNGDGTFTDVATQAGVDHSDESIGTAFFDYDNDGDLDIFCTNKYRSDILYANDGDGTFTDVTAEAGVGHTGWNGGTAVGDYDNDGYLDMYVCNHTGVNILYRNNGDGTFSDVALEAGVGDDGFGAGAVFGDYDSDGDLDLYLGNQDSPDFLYRNNGDGTFSDVTSVVGLGHPGHASCPQFGDYDNDGDLDLYLSNYGYYYTDPNILYRNNGDGTFTDVTTFAGVGDANKGADARFGDYDNDGDLDIYLANRGQANVLYRNNGDGTFTDVSTQAGVDDPGFDLGAAWGDYDNDGDLDMYVVDHEGANTLYRNNTHGNHWLVVKTVGTISNRDGIGAWVKVVAADLIQVREVEGRSGNYGQNSIPVEFGLGQHDHIDSMIVRWPSGTVQVLTDVIPDRYMEVIEDVNTPLVSLQNYEIDDGDGNSDGIVDPGETISLSITLRNRGLEATGVRAWLSTTDPYISMIQIVSCFDNLPMGSVVDNTVSPFRFSVHEDCPRTRTISFTLEITSAEDYRHSVRFDLQIAAHFSDVSVVAGVNDTTNAGGALFADFDNDGFLDLYVVNRDYGKKRNILYFNNGDGTFRDDTEAAGVGRDTRGGVVAGDYDNDGDLDLYLANRFEEPNLLYRNDGHGFFQEVSEAAGVAHRDDDIDPVFGDYDNDGDLDIFISVYGRNVLYRNNGDGTFADVASEAKVGYDGQTRASTFTDYDGDGDLDLYVLNKFDENILYRNNDDGTFTDVTHGAGVVGHGNAFGVSSGDVDNDGDFDLYVCNHFQPNILFRNNGDGTFTDVAEEAGVDDDNEGRSAALGDYDNDGYLDIYVTNYSEPSILFHNNGDGTFSDVTTFEGVAREALCGSVIWGDYDLDGDLDLFLKDNDHGNTLFRNNGNANHWLVVTTVGTISNRNGIGAQVTVCAGELRQVREVNGGFGLGCQSSLPLEYGLGQQTNVDSIVIRWPSGVVQVLTDISADQYLEVTEEVTTPLLSIADFEIDDSGGNDDGWIDPGETVSLTVTIRNRGLDAQGVTAQLFTEDPYVTITQAEGDYGEIPTGGQAANAQTPYLFTVTPQCPRGQRISFTLEMRAEGEYVHVETFEVSVSPMFVDVTLSAGVGNDDWGVGVAWGDYDGDDFIDLYVTNGRDGTNVLFHNDGDGSFTEAAAGAGVRTSGYGKGASFGDYDNDGDLDLYVVYLNDLNYLFENNGDGTFSDITSEAGVGSNIAGEGVSWGDLDNDGDLDIYLANFMWSNVLFRNNGDGTFTNVAEQAGVEDTEGGGFGSSLADYDNDGDLDIYVANATYLDDGDPVNRLYRNNGDGTFTDVAAQAGVAHGGDSHSGDFGDFNNDGHLDLFLSSAYGSSNRLFRNNGDGTFSDVTESAGLFGYNENSCFTWGDFDNDGYLDLFVTFIERPNVFYRNTGAETFSEHAIAQDKFEYKKYNQLACGDYDRDGDLDVYVSCWDASNVLYRNVGEGHHWLHVEIHGLISNRDGIGARVTVVAGNLRMTREVRSGNGYASQNSLPLEFGLGQNTQADSVIIRWPSGTLQVLIDIPADQYLDVIEEVTTPFIVFKGYETDDSEGNANGNIDPGETISLVVIIQNLGLDAMNVSGLLSTDDPYITITQLEGDFGTIPMGSTATNMVSPFRFSVDPVCPRGRILRFNLETRPEGDPGEFYAFYHIFTMQVEPIFSDVTVAAGVGDSVGGAGLVFADFNNDDFLDLYVPSWLYHPANLLYLNNQNGTFADVTAVAGVGDEGRPGGVAVGDYDNDGDSDIYVSNRYDGPNVLFENQGNGTFIDVSEAAGVRHSADCHTTLFGDYNNDGYVDLFVAVYGSNVLYKNNGNGTFTNVTAQANLSHSGEARSAMFTDYNGDGHIDLYLLHKYAENVLYKNNGDGTFTDVTVQAGVEGSGNDFCATSGDMDNDGDFDLYLSNHFQRNMLYRNNGDGTFTDIAGMAGVDDPNQGRSASFGDYDNDGYLDIYLGNSDGPNRLYHNNGNGTFTDVAPQAGVFYDKTGSNFVWGDYDRDGNLDLFLKDGNGHGNHLFRNNGGSNHWLVIRTVGTVSNRDGYGANVTVRAGSLIQVREVSAGNGYGCQNSLEIEFGLGGQTEADSVVIHWPSGAVQVLTDVPADRYLEITEDVTTPFISLLDFEIDDSVGNGDGDVDPGETVSLVVTLENRGLDATGVRAILSSENPYVTIHQDLSEFGDMPMGTVAGNADDPYVMTLDAQFAYAPFIVFNLEINADGDYSNIDALRIEMKPLFTEISELAGVDDRGSSYGVAFGDVNRDGYLDILSGNYYEPVSLYLNNGNVSFTNITTDAFFGQDVRQAHAYFFDFDNDGDLDIYNGSETLYQNDGTGHFTRAPGISVAERTLGSWGSAFGDVDNDGDVDLFTGDILLKNDGSGGFTFHSKLEGNYDVRSVAFADIDMDGDLDLYIGKDYDGPNRMYQNDGTGRFTEITGRSRTGYNGGTGLNFGDIDNDGDLDLYVCKNGENRLFQNDGHGIFTDITGVSNTVNPTYNRSCQMGDMDNDGDIDIVINNATGPNTLLSNDGSGVFSDITDIAGVGDLGNAQGNTLGDIDNDGDLDIYVGNCNQQPNRLFLNNESGHHYLNIRTVGTVSNRSGIGAWVWVVTGERRQLRHVYAGSGHISMNSLEVEFGLGQYTEADSIIVRWPSGIIQVLTNVAADQFLTITEPSGKAVIVSIPEASAMPGDTGSIYIDVDNVTHYSSSVSGMEFVLTYNPALLEVVDVERVGRTYETRNNSWALYWTVKTPGELEILIWDLENIGVQPGIGPVAELFFAIAKEADLGGRTTIGFKKTILSDPGANYLLVLASGGKLTFGLKGDVTGSGALNILDVLAIVNIIIGVIPDPTPYQLWAADMDDNGLIDVVDVIALIKRLIGDDDRLVEGEEKVTANVGLAHLLHDHQTISLTVDSPVPIAGIQAKLSVEANDEISLRPQVTERSLFMNVVSNRDSKRLAVLLYNLEGEMMPAGTGSILTFEVETKKAGIPIEVILEEIVLVDSEGERMESNILSSAVNMERILPEAFSLLQNYPNPFNPITDIGYQMPDNRSPLHITLKVYNILGQEIRTLVDQVQEAGYYTVTWDGRDGTGEEVPSGVYFYQLSVNGSQWSETKRMVMMK